MRVLEQKTYPSLSNDCVLQTPQHFYRCNFATALHLPVVILADIHRRDFGPGFLGCLSSLHLGMVEEVLQQVHLGWSHVVEGDGVVTAALRALGRRWAVCLRAGQRGRRCNISHLL